VLDPWDMTRSEDFSFDFAEDVDEFVILRRDIREVGSLHKMCEVYLNIQRLKIDLKFARVWKF